MQMLSLHSVAYCYSAPSTKALRFSATKAPSRVSRNLRARCFSSGDKKQEPISNFGGVQLEEAVDVKAAPAAGGKLRLDSWISSRIAGISRARVQSSIRSGLVSVNGHVVNKVSHNVKAGDKVNCTISELQPLRAEPEDIPLDIVYEDDHVLVVNKAAHMVVHPAPGNATGTLVNGILHHCSLPTEAFSYREVISDAEDISDDEGLCSSVSEASVRPGIVHRLDKGTSGLLVVAKVNFPTWKPLEAEKSVICFRLLILLSKIELAIRLTCRVGRMNILMPIYQNNLSYIPSREYISVLLQK